MFYKTFSRGCFSLLFTAKTTNYFIKTKQSSRLLCYLAKMVEDVAAKRSKTEQKIIGTHDGAFHCDEILACFMLQQLPEYSNSKIVRSRDETKLAECDIVVDVGAVFDPEKKRFDHHQKTFGESLSSLKPELPGYDIKLSSAGLIFCFYGEEVIAQMLKKEDIDVDPKCLKVLFKKVYESLIQEIDGIDNGVPQFEGGEPRYTISTNLSSRVSHFNQTWNSDAPYDAMENFEKAKSLVGQELLDKILYYQKAWWPARKIVQDAIDTRFEVHASGEILSLSRFCPWKQHLAELEVENGIENVPKYVLYEDRQGDYRIICVPIQPDSFICRKFLHKDWRGVRDNEIQQISGIPSAKFCHTTGFIGGATTKEGQLAMAVQSLLGEFTD